MTPRTHEELYDAINRIHRDQAEWRNEMRASHQLLRSDLNIVSEKMVLVRSDLNGLITLKNKGVGFLAAIGLAGGLLILGLKSWLANLIKGIV